MAALHCGSSIPGGAPKATGAEPPSAPVEKAVRGLRQQITGKIVTRYNGESRDWRLDQRPFVSTLEGGEWRMCGYK